MYAIANENQRLHDMLTSKNNMLDDYISDKHVPSTLSNKSSLSVTHGKRQRTKGPAKSIIDTLKNKSEAVIVKTLKSVLTDTSLKSAVAQAGFINQSNPEYAAMKESWENTKKFVGYATSTDKKEADLLMIRGVRLKHYWLQLQ